MNGAIDKLTHIANMRRRATTQQLLVRVGAPAMALLGMGAIGAVLFGLQCGGLDQCFVRSTPTVPTSEAPAAVSPAPAEASLGPTDAVPAAAPAPAPAPAASAVALAAPPPVSEGAQRAQRVDRMIGDTFVALASDDAGWLSGASANAAADPETYAEGDGAGPAMLQETAAEAADAVAAVATQPLQRPTPLDVAAFAAEPSQTSASVQADAERKLAEVAKSQPEPAAEPAPQQPAAEPEPAPAPEQSEPAGDTRIVAGSGVNVRSGPGKSNGRVFGLAGGETVTVGDNQRGWLKITDDQGRTGWVYKDYLN